jgi:hypothetical protein
MDRRKSLKLMSLHADALHRNTCSNPPRTDRHIFTWASAFDGKQPPRPGHTLQLVLAFVRELDARAHQEAPHCLAQEHLAQSSQVQTSSPTTMSVATSMSHTVAT